MTLHAVAAMLANAAWHIQAFDIVAGTTATLFDVIAPEEFRRVLAAPMGQISRM
jgi:hypothetical protein